MNLRPVHDGLFISGHTRGLDPEYSYEMLQSAGINAVFCVAPRADEPLRQYLVERGGVYRHEPLPDGSTIDPMKVWNLAQDLVYAAPALIHCNAGRNRAPFITALALVLRGWEPEAAIDHLRSLRPSALANEHFVRFIRKGMR